MNISNPAAAEIWCHQHLEWVKASEDRIASEVSPGDSHTIFRIGDATRLPVDPVHAHQDGEAFKKMHWLRYYSNQLHVVLDQYRELRRLADVSQIKAAG